MSPEAIAGHPSSSSSWSATTTEDENGLFSDQDAQDPRVVKPESDQIVERLRARGVEVRYDVYEDEGHGFTKRENELRAMHDTAAFMETYLLGDEA